MKMSKKIVALTAIAAMVVTAVPVSQSLSEVKAASFSALAKYDFEGSTGMSTGVGGTAPTVVNDSERGSVLQFADGSGSTIERYAANAKDEKSSNYRIVEGSPSSLKFSNPFRGENLSGATIAMWVKVPTEKAAGLVDDEVDESLAVASGLVGFVDSQERPLVHPDCKDGGHSDQVYSGRTFFGVSAQPCVYFNQIHHNSLVYKDTDATLANTVGQWKYLAVAITNDTVVCYIDGQEVKGGEVDTGKRFKSNEVHDDSGNDGMPYLLDYLTDNMSYTFGGVKGTHTFTDKNSGKSVTYGKIDSDVSGYVGFTGFSGTQSGVCIDDLAFFGKAYSASEMAALFEAAKSGDISGGPGNNNTNTKGEKEETVEIGDDKAGEIADSVQVQGASIESITAVLSTDEAYNTLKTALNNGIAAVVASNAEWNGLVLSNNYYPFSIKGTVDAGAVATITMENPFGAMKTVKMNNIWVLHIADDGTVTKCNTTSVTKDGITFEADQLGNFAVVVMTTKLPKTGVVSTSLFVLFGASAVAGGSCMLKRKKED